MELPDRGEAPWLDQITLPLTLARFGYRARVLPEQYNYSLSHRADYAQTPGDAAVLHYHRFRFLAQAPQWPALRARLFDTAPVRLHAELTAFVAQIDQAHPEVAP